MTRLCFGPACRDLTPVRGPRSLYCAECRRELNRIQRLKANRRWLRKPENRATKRASTLAWYHRQKEAA